MSAAHQTAIVWFRRDLRLTDNPALRAAAADSARVIPVFIHAPEEEVPWQPGAASNWWLHHSLAALTHDLQQQGAPLVIRQGNSLAELAALIKATGATAVYWNRLYEPAIIARDAQVQTALTEQNIHTETFNGYLLLEPGTIRSKSATPYKVFTPFWRVVMSRLDIPPPEPPPKLAGLDQDMASLPLDALELLPDIHWDAGLNDAWTPGEAAALEQLADFVAATVGQYAGDRDRPDRPGTSRLSPHLHFGEISPQQVLWAAEQAAATAAALDHGVEVFEREIGWREFAHHLMVDFPHTVNEPLRAEFKEFPWREPDDDDPEYLGWCRGRTGIPLVDAGMRELWHTGWMHNRVRMVVASFLTKNQLIGWQSGAKWFWDTLVDANLASNTLGWQWTAGCGADAAPFFRIFNPVRQGEKFDPDERYIRRWCPELESIPQGQGHAPGATSAPGAAAIDLRESRTAALEAFRFIKKST